MSTPPPPKGSNQSTQQEPELLELLDEDIAEVDSEQGDGTQHSGAMPSPTAPMQSALPNKPLRPMPIELAFDQELPPSSSPSPIHHATTILSPEIPSASSQPPQEALDPIEPLDMGFTPLLSHQGTQTATAPTSPASPGQHQTSKPAESVDLELLALPELPPMPQEDLLDALAPLPQEPPQGAPLAPVMQEIEQAIVNLPQSQGPAWAPDLTPTASAQSTPWRSIPVVLAGLGSVLLLMGLLAGGWIYYQEASTSASELTTTPAPALTAEGTQPKQEPSATAQSPTQDETLLLAPLPEFAPLQVPTPITLQHIDSLGYWSLKRGCAALQDEMALELNKPLSPQALAQRTLLWWGWYRLASTYQDETAKEQLIAVASGPLPINRMLSSRAQAALIGGMLWSSQKELLNKGKALLKSPVGKTAFGLWVLANHMPPAPTGRAALLQRIVKLEPTLLDARFARAAHGIGMMDEPEPLVEELLRLAQLAPEDGPIRAALLLYQLRAYRSVSQMLSTMPHHPAKESLAPQHYDGFTMLMVRSALSQGQLRVARRWAKHRALLMPQDLLAAKEWAALQPATSALERDRIYAALMEPRNEVEQAQLRYERIHQLLTASEVQAAKALLAPEPPPEQAATELPYWYWLATARLAEQEGNLPASRTAYQQASRFKPTALLPRAGLAKQGGSEQEKNLLLQLLRQGSSGPLQLRLAHLLEAKGNTQEAINAYVNALWQDPSLPDVTAILRHLAGLYRASQQPALAIPILLDDMESQPTLALEQAQGMLQLTEQGQNGVAALKIAQRYATAHPNDGEGLQLLARAHLLAQERPQALAVLHQLMKQPQFAQNPNVLALSGYAYGSSDPIKARMAFLAAIQLRPDPTLYGALADLDAGRGKIDDAITHLQTSLQLDPQQLERSLQLAKWLLQKGMFKESTAHLHQMVKRWPQEGRLGALLGQALREQGLSQAAFDAYQAALPHCVLEEKANILLAMAELQLHDLGHLEQAITYLRQAIGHQPSLADAHYLLGLALKDVGKIGESKKHLQHYLKLEPQGSHSKEIKQLWLESGW